MYEKNYGTSSQPIVIGIDHGFSLMKTGGGIIFSNGIVRTGGRPLEVKGSLYYDGNYYSIGGNEYYGVKVHDPSFSVTERPRKPNVFGAFLC